MAAPRTSSYEALMSDARPDPLEDAAQRDRNPARGRPKDAATLILVRRDGREPRLLMGRRSAGHAFMPAKWVFPGGRVDRADHRAPVLGELPPEEAMETLVVRTRRYAAYQRKWMRRIPGLVNVDTDLRVNKPELSVVFDRDRAEDVGVSVRDVATTLQTLLGGRDVTTFTQQNKLYDVIVRMAPDDRATPLDVSGLAVRGRDGGLVQLDAVTRVVEGVGPRQLNHFQRVRSFTLTANLAPGYPLGSALDALTAAAAETLPPGSSTSLAGESRDLRETGSALYVTFGLAILIVFMVLASQFESLAHPITVLTAVPLAVTGALATLWLTGSTLNLYSQIALILLVGLVCKNSILLVNYANQERETGKDVLGAMIEAGRIRLRPILMTSAAATTGALPIALGLGAGSASRRPMGYAIVGGLLVSTLLTLYLVPAVYVAIAGVQERLARRRARTAADRTDLNTPPPLRPMEAP